MKIKDTFKKGLTNHLSFAFLKNNLLLILTIVIGVAIFSPIFQARSIH